MLAAFPHVCKPAVSILGLRAADRGVKVRFYLDGTQLVEGVPTRVFQDLAETPGAEANTQRPNAPQELPNRRAIAAHRRRELFRVQP